MSPTSLMLLWVGVSQPAVVPEAPRPPAAFTLTWSGAPECGSAAAIQARVEALLSGPPQGEGVAEVVGVVRRGPTQVELELTTIFEGGKNTRRMKASSCKDLVEATAVLLSVALEPGLSEPEGSAPTTLVEPPPAPPRPVALVAAERLSSVGVAANRSEREGQAQRPVGGPRLSLGVAGGVEYGGLAAATGALRLSLGARGRSWSAEALGTYLTPRQVQRDGLGGRHQLGTAGLRGCWHRAGPGLGAEFCGGVEAGGLRVDSEGVSPSVNITGPYVGPAASVAGVWAWSRFAFSLRAEGVVPVWGSQTRVRGEVLLKPFPVSFRMFAGVRVLFL